ncbi:MAG: alpha-amylase [Blautia sp.]|nr:alpha-amylase [Blautia sp.]
MEKLRPGKRGYPVWRMIKETAFVLMAAVLLSPLCFFADISAEEQDGQSHDAAFAETQTGSSTCYEIFVYSFRDSDGDRIGDLDGVKEELDYICGKGEDSLGCDMIWLMPVFPSPTYHKYDVTDYEQIDPQYGTLEDMESLLSACHERGVRLILDLPLNHTSTAHPWFTEAEEYIKSLENGQEGSAEDCPYIDFYNFSLEKQDGFEPLEDTGWYYEARFWAGMPDLNLDNEAVRDEIARILSFWQEKGVDGFRLDAVTSYYTQSKEKSISFVEWLTETAKAFDPDCYLVGEAWTDQDTYLQYYESGIDSMFDFAFAGQEGVIASVARGNKQAAWYGQRLVEEEEKLEEYGGLAVNAPFYTNHDMARSAGYYPNDGGARTKFAWALNLLMPGNAFLYYGEEIGMNGSGKDENKRAPMRWDEDPSASGMCKGPDDMDAVSMIYPALKEQEGDPSSVFSCVKKAIGLRQEYPAIAGGKTILVEKLSGKEICTLIRTMEGEKSILMVINASQNDQLVDLSVLEEEAEASAILRNKDSLTLTPYAIALLAEGEEDWVYLNEGCVLPEKSGRRRR